MVKWILITTEMNKKRFQLFFRNGSWNRNEELNSAFIILGIKYKV